MANCFTGEQFVYAPARRPLGRVCVCMRVCDMYADTNTGWTVQQNAPRPQSPCTGHIFALVFSTAPINCFFVRTVFINSKPISLVLFGFAFFAHFPIGPAARLHFSSPGHHPVPRLSLVSQSSADGDYALHRLYTCITGYSLASNAYLNRHRNRFGSHNPHSHPSTPPGQAKLFADIVVFSPTCHHIHIIVHCSFRIL